MHDNIVKKRFGWWVQDKREAMGLTRTQLADMCELNVYQISKIEVGTNLPYGERMIRLLIALGVDDECGALREILKKMEEK